MGFNRANTLDREFQDLNRVSITSGACSANGFNCQTSVTLLFYAYNRTFNSTISVTWYGNNITN